MPLCSIVIPTNRPPEVVAPCLDALAKQSVGSDLIEVILAYNGVAERPVWRTASWPFKLHIEHQEAANIASAKNAALATARGEWVVFLNDDVIPERDFLQQHLAAHEAAPNPAMVLGQSKWCVYPDQNIFDCLVAESSMIFFYDRMEAHAWYGFRHAWNLNLSVHRRFVSARQFDERLGPFFFEDIELAFRLEREEGVRVWYQPEAAAYHNHRYTLDGYLARERALGEAAVRLWFADPACFEATYRSELDQRFRDYCRQYVEFDGFREEELRDRLAEFVAEPATTLPTEQRRRKTLLQLLYEAHLPLKRLAFRRGLLAEYERRASASRMASTG